VPAISAGLSDLFDIDPAATRLALAAILGALVIPMGARLRPHVDRALFPERVALQEGAAGLIEELSDCESPEALLERAAERTTALFDAAGMALYERRGDELLLRRQEGLAGVATALKAGEAPARAAPRNTPAALAPDVALVVPLSSGSRIDALLALGPKRRGDIYTRDDAAVLTSIAARVEAGWLRFQKRAADRRSREKSNLLAAASHDLRQPLHAMSLLTEALRGRLDDPDVRDLVTRIGESTHDLDEMLSGVLDLSKIEAGGLEPDLRDVALSDVFAQLERDFLPAARQSH
jgi:signal transduction histidine kinase